MYPGRTPPWMLAMAAPANTGSVSACCPQWMPSPEVHTAPRSPAVPTATKPPVPVAIERMALGIGNTCRSPEARVQCSLSAEVHTAAAVPPGSEVAPTATAPGAPDVIRATLAMAASSTLGAADHRRVVWRLTVPPPQPARSTAVTTATVTERLTPFSYPGRGSSSWPYVGGVVDG